MPEEPDEPADDASVLTPDELQLEDEREDAVRKIGENRFVIRPNEDDSDDEAASEDPKPGPLADTDQHPSSNPRSSSPREDTAGRDGSSEPSLTDVREDAEAQSASSPASTSSRQDAGGRDASSEPSLTDVREDAPTRSAPNVGVEARATALEQASGEYAIDAVVDTGDGIAERRLAADDRIAVFEEFLRWYARQVDPDASPAATISALLAEADLSE